MSARVHLAAAAAAILVGLTAAAGPLRVWASGTPATVVVIEGGQAPFAPQIAPGGVRLDDGVSAPPPYTAPWLAGATLGHHRVMAVPADTGTALVIWSPLQALVPLLAGIGVTAALYGAALRLRPLLEQLRVEWAWWRGRD